MNDAPISEPQREPVSTLADLETLDDDEILEGYKDGREGFPCSGNRSRAYWHGWQNGMVDAGRMEPTEHSQALAKAFLASMKDARLESAIRKGSS